MNIFSAYFLHLENKVQYNHHRHNADNLENKYTEKVKFLKWNGQHHQALDNNVNDSK